jgi:G3E family GTPase
LKNIPVYLITGFLGSGKTTLIQNLLDNYFSDRKLAVIQNEFAPHNFDGKELKRRTTRDFDMLEVNNGSVFCVCLLANFVSSFSNFLNDCSPDVVLFETSGLSDPIAMGEIFNSPQLSKNVFLSDIICVVDSTGFLKLEKFQQRMVHQVQVANKIIINKTDLQPNHQIILEKVGQLTPMAGIISASYCMVPADELLRGIDFNNGLDYRISAEDLGRPDIKSVVVKTTHAVKKSGYIQFLNEIAPETIRLKGYLLLDSGESISFQYAGHSIESMVINRNIKQTEIIAMGYELTPGELKRIYKKYCN